MPAWPRFLSDGTERVDRSDVATVLDELAARLAEDAFRRDVAVALPLRNTVGGALRLLALLQAGQSVLLLAEPGTQAPRFCERILDHDGPLDRLTWRPNPAFAGASPVGAGRVYLSSSGTSGAAKLVAHDHSRLMRQAEACIDRFELTAADTVIVTVPIFHMFGLGAAFLPAVFAGAAVELIADANLPRFLSHEAEARPNVAFMVPSFAETLLRGRRADRSYRLTVMAGDRIRASTFSAYEARFGPVVQLYGSSEMGAIASTTPHDPQQQRQHSVGLPLPGVELRLDGPDKDQLMCRHAHGFVGYAGEDGVLTPAGDWWFTKDRALFSDGAFRILGRADDHVKRDGVLVSLRAMELALEALPNVESAAVVTAAPGPRGLDLVGFCTATPGTAIDAIDLKRRLASTGSRGLVPDRIEMIRQMPLLASGKLDRQALGARATASEAVRSVKVLQVEPTTRCNFTCGFCAGRKMDQSDLPFDIYLKALDQFPYLEEIELHGQGEPLSHARFFDMANEAKRRGIRVSTITNGSMFSRQNIEALLAAGIRSILVSIESTRPETFASLRGGKLEKVVAGIRALLDARRARGITLPVVGFAVTALKATQHELRAIADLYRELDMDGGIALHMLIPMRYHADGYDEAMRAQLLTPTERALSWARYAKIVRDPSYVRSDVVHACDQIYGYGEILESGSEKTSRAWVNAYDRCPWLERGLYLNRHRQITACSRILDGDTHALGVVGTDEPDEILQRRDRMASVLASGGMPAACRGCFIAESVAARAGRLLHRHVSPAEVAT